MTWEIVVGIITLLGAAVSVGTLVAKLSRALGVLDTSIRSLQGTIESMKKDSRETHRHFHERIEDHETRITVLEHR